VLARSVGYCHGTNHGVNHGVNDGVGKGAFISGLFASHSQSSIDANR
jgi:hypothetical protein